MIGASTSYDITDSSIFLNWTVASGVSSPVTYTVWWNPPSETGFSNISGLGETFTTVSNLQSNTVYSIRIVASNGVRSDEIPIATSKYNKTKRIFLVTINLNKKSIKDQWFLTK